MKLKNQKYPSQIKSMKDFNSFVINHPDSVFIHYYTDWFLLAHRESQFKISLQTRDALRIRKRFIQMHEDKEKECYLCTIRPE